MKFLKSILTSFLLLLSLTCFSQLNVVNTNASAKIGVALSIQQMEDLHFGTMTTPTANVNVILSTYGTRTSTNPSALFLLSQSPYAHSALYNVYGEKNEHYVIILPPNNTVTINSGSNFMHVDDFVSRSDSKGEGHFDGKLNHIGFDYFYVGATLKLLNQQPNGEYVGYYTITVAYN